MIRPVADMHTHTIATDHAYSTLLENIRYANLRGLKGLAMTEHGPELPDSPSGWHFGYDPIPRIVEGIMVFRGIELNIMDVQGSVDRTAQQIQRLDWVIASMHQPVFPARQPVEAVTEAWLRIAQNPLIDCIGHCGDGNFVFDYEAVIPVFGQHGKAVEINHHSFGARRGSEENCRRIALLCKKHGVPVVVTTDAHFALSVGVFDCALSMLEEIGFPEELVLNADLGRLIDFINAKPHKNKIERSE